MNIIEVNAQEYIELLKSEHDRQVEKVSQKIREADLEIAKLKEEISDLVVKSASCGCMAIRPLVFDRSTREATCPSCGQKWRQVKVDDAQDKV